MNNALKVEYNDPQKYALKICGFPFTLCTVTNFVEQNFGLHKMAHCVSSQSKWQPHYYEACMDHNSLL